MNGCIPNIIEPYPDELLFSWVKRLAEANGLSFDVFFKTYFGEKGTIQDNLLPLDARRGFLDFCKFLNCEVDSMDLYFQLSTAQFELSFYPPKLQTRTLHNIIRPESKMNTSTDYFISKPKICLECMKEDAEQYGEFFLHRSHHLSGVTACHKHETPLYEVHRLRGQKYIYDFENPIPLVQEMTKQDVEYAKYAYCLLSNDIMTTGNDILHIIFDAMNPKGDLMKLQIAEEISNNILHNPIKKNKWTRQDVIFPPEDTIQILMYLYPDANDFLSIVKRRNLIIKKHCKKCNKDYYTTQYAIDMGWGCVYCDAKLSEQKLFERLVRIGGNNEYELKSSFKNLGEKVILHHKVCGEDSAIPPGRFLYKHTRCYCRQKLLKKDADKIMKQYPDFELISFRGAVFPATFRHKICGEVFEVMEFRDFVENPKCRCCEIQQNITPKEFEKRVKDIVGDEYTITGEITTLSEKVAIKHNLCGHIHEFKPYEFLSGSRCPQCHQNISNENLEIMLQEYSAGRYEIIGNDNYKFIIKDNKTEEIIRLKGNHIIQEIIRPTPSLVLPVEKTTKTIKSLDTWDRWYNLCIDYKNEFGHMCPMGSEKYRGHALGEWCSEQRMAFNKGELTEDKIKRLEQIDFIFNYAFYSWNKRFDEYKAYVEETGNYFPRTDCIHNGNKVGSWFLGQRKERKRGRLNPEFEKILLEYYSDFFKERKLPPKKKKDYILVPN